MNVLCPEGCPRPTAQTLAQQLRPPGCFYLGFLQTPTCMVLLICSQSFPLSNFCISQLLSSRASWRLWGCSAQGEEMQRLQMLTEEQRQLKLGCSRSWAQEALSWA